MSYLYYILGFAITLFTLVDLVWTTLWVDGGAGPMSKRIAKVTWHIGEKSKYLLGFIGPMILVFTLLSWVFSMWLGLALFYSGDPQSIINTTTGGSIMWYERVYFTGYTIFTLGMGDYSPQPGFWQIVTAVTSGVGILFLTLGASYVINVVNAVVNKRSFARTVTGLGMTCEDIVREAWDGKDFNQLNLVLMNASTAISTLTQQHQAYPLLHFYHSRNPEESSAIGIAILDDVLSVLHFGLENDEVVNTVLVKETRSSIETYLDTLTKAFVYISEKEPRRPDLEKLEKLGVALNTSEVFSRDMDTVVKRRRQLLGAVASDKHEWPEERE